MQKATEAISDAKSISTWYLNLTVFMGGAATMMVEFGASRLLGNVFGTSNIVWAVIIGLVLVYLTLGNWLGGKLADKDPSPIKYFSLLCWSGVAVGIVPLISHPILRIAADAFDALQINLMAGAFFTVLVLLILPVTLLGMITPFALKLLIPDTSRTGRVAGKASAIATLGSFLGTFLTVLVLIPLVGTYRTFLITSLVLLLTALPGLVWSGDVKRATLFICLSIILLILAVFGLQSSVKASPGMIYEAESAYNYIQVLQIDSFRYLRLNEGQGVHSIYHPTQLFYGGPWSQVLVAPYFNPPPAEEITVKHIAILGLAAGTTARQASVVYPQAQIDGFEIDPKIIEVGKQFFGMDLPNLNIYAQDARWGIAHSDKTYDIMSVDAYRSPYIPPHLVTQEFFEILYDKLNPHGVVAINVGRSNADRTLVEAMCATMSRTFPQIFVMDIPDSMNTIVFAAKNPMASWENFHQNLSNLQTTQPDSLLVRAMNLTLHGKADTKLSDVVFTDDKSAIEFITNRLVIDLLLDTTRE
jgi:spermidine synthase